MRTVLLSIGDRVEPGRYELHSRFQRACNFSRSGRLVCVVEESVGAGPLNVVLAGFRESSPSFLCVETEAVVVAGCRLRFSEALRYRSALHIPSSNPQHFRRNLSAFAECLARTAPAASLVSLIDESRTVDVPTGFAQVLAGEVARNARELFCGDLFAGVAGLKGCGPGLTPSGDDFLAGVLTGLHVVQQMRRQDFRAIRDAIFGAAVGENLFSNNFLAMAHSGLVGEHVQKLVAALVTGGADEVAAATSKLVSLGSTSGADFGTGLCMTLRDEGEFAMRYEGRSAPRLPAGPVPDNAQVGAWS